MESRIKLDDLGVPLFLGWHPDDVFRSYRSGPPTILPEV